MSLVRLKLRRDLQAVNRALNVSLLKQGLTQFKARITIIRLNLKDFAHQLNTTFSLLSRERNIAQVIFRLKVSRVHAQLSFKFAVIFLELSRLQVDHSRVEVRQARFSV